MKLLNREPTEEMCIAAREKIGVSANAADYIFQAMYDAAPELTVDMEPVATIIGTGYKNDNYNHWVDTKLKNGTKLYSAEQVATLQSENERLRSEVAHWKEFSHDEYWKQVKKITAERDELQEMLSEVWSTQDKHEWDDDFVKEVDEALAKHEGEKHETQ